jgi:hypothetical protein
MLGNDVFEHPGEVPLGEQRRPENPQKVADIGKGTFELSGHLVKLGGELRADTFQPRLKRGEPTQHGEKRLNRPVVNVEDDPLKLLLGDSQQPPGRELAA